MKHSTKEKIVSAAIDLFAQYGKHGATTAQITKAAGINKAAVCYYFHGKDNLYRLVLKTVILHFLTTFEREVFRNIHEHNVEIRSAVIRVFSDYFQNHPKFIKLLHWELAGGGKELQLLHQQIADSKNFRQLSNTIAIMWHINHNGNDDTVAKVEFVKFLGTILVYPLLQPVIELIFGIDKNEKETFFKAFISQ